MKSDALHVPADAVAEQERVVAAVVTYNPGPYLEAHLAALRKQIGEVVVIDNGSSDLQQIRQACAATDCRLVANQRNLGIATALNQGAREALAGNAVWFAMFDQDSLLPPAAIETLLTVAKAHPSRQRIGVMALSHKDRGTGRPYHVRSDVLEETATWRVLRTTITSGSLVRCDVLREAGLFEDRLFIDFVDHEFCMRIRRRGWLVVEAPQVLMAHSIGASRVHSVLGRQTVFTHHSPLRRYYMIRNQLEICRRNLLFDPVWSGKGLIGLVASTALVLVIEQQKLAKLFATVRACIDVAMRRFGPRY